LIEAADREWEMELPVPVPLSSLAPILQLRNISAGFLNQCSPGEGQEISEDQGGSSSSRSTTTIPSPPPPVSMPTNNAPKASTSTTKKLKVLGSGKKKISLGSEETPTETPVNMTKILDSITLDLDQNTKIAIVGKNGCGKR
jgi:ABC-type multidrug transport system fused ATPase/permease subunit